MFTLGLYSEFLVFTVIFFKSRRVPKKTVLIVFLKAYSKEKQLMDESLPKKHKSKEKLGETQPRKNRPSKPSMARTGF